MDQDMQETRIEISSPFLLYEEFVVAYAHT
jgi:hypothetical protein